MGTALAYFAFVFLSAFSLGALGMSIVLDLKLADGWKDTGRWRAFMKFGVMLIVGILLWVVIPNQQVDPSPYFWVYMTGLLFTIIGGFGTVFGTIATYIERQETGVDHKEKGG